MYAKDGSRIFMKLISQINKIHKQEVKNIRTEMDEERDRFQKNLKNFEDFKKDFSEKAEFERKYFKDQKKLLEDALEDARMAISGNSVEYSNLQKKLRQENLELTRQIAEINNKPPSINAVEPDLTGLKDFIQGIVKESQQLKQDKTLTDLKLEYEMKTNSIFYLDTERTAQKQIFEAKKMTDQTVAQMKKSYEKEIKGIREENIACELKLKDLAREILQRDMQIKILNEKFRGREEERKVRIEHSDLLISVSELIIKFLKKLETGKGGDLTEEIDVLQERASRLSRF